MRSYDQFSNIVLEDTHERHFVGGELRVHASQGVDSTAQVGEPWICHQLLLLGVLLLCGGATTPSMSLLSFFSHDLI